MTARMVRGVALRFAFAVAALPACSSDDTTTPPAGSAPAGGTVDVTLQEFAISTSVATAAAGSLTFEATNNGPDDDHEFVVIKTDLGITDLPTKPDGSVDEEGAGIEIINEIEPFPPGNTKTLTVDLDAGNYVFICNIYDKEENEAHYQEGMRTPFTVS
jgi:uncharacterized cupredoxin-like copper-binding protein